MTINNLAENKAEFKNNLNAVENNFSDFTNGVGFLVKKLGDDIFKVGLKSIAAEYKKLSGSAGINLKEITQMSRNLSLYRENYLQAFSGNSFGEKLINTSKTYITDYQERLDMFKWYWNEYDKINKDGSLSVSEKSEQFNQLELRRTDMYNQSQKLMSEKHGQELQAIIGGNLYNMIGDFNNFGDNLKLLGKDLLNFGGKIVVDNFINAIFNSDFLKGTAGSEGGNLMGWLSNIAGFGLDFLPFGKILSPIAGVVRKLFRFHSGGHVPYSSYSIPGTGEQLSLLKGGERVLSPAENTSYENANRGSNIQVLNFNVKAWDSKDVSSYFKENSNLIQQITANGIRSNQNGLRTIVQGV